MVCHKCQSKVKAHKSGLCSACRRSDFKERSNEQWSNADFKEKWAKSCTFKPQSALNVQVGELLGRLGLKFIPEHLIGPWSFDFFLPEQNLLIECQGEYWHSLTRRERADRAKASYVENHTNYRLLEVWEVEFYQEGRLEHIIRNATDRKTAEPKAVDFSGLSLKQVEKRQVNLLYGSYHYLGSARGKYHYGLFYNGNLIGACSFGAFQRLEQNKKYEGALELTRFCVDPAYQVKNISSWFLSRCMKLVGGTIVTYADLTQGHTGALYKACNFRFSHEVPSDYHYVSKDGWVMHKKTLWNRAVSMKMTEPDYASKHSMEKRFGAAKLCFVYEAGRKRACVPLKDSAVKKPGRQKSRKVAQPYLDVRLIKNELSHGESASKLAARYGCSRSMIFAIKRLRQTTCATHGELWSRTDKCPKCRALAGSKAGGEWIKEAMK